VTFFIQKLYKMHCSIRLHGQNGCYVIFWNIAPKHWIYMDRGYCNSFHFYVPLGETYCVCSVSYYITPTVVGWCIAILRFFFTIIITSPRLLSGDVLLFYVSFSLLLLRHPERSRVTYCYSIFLFHYYYYYYYTYYSSTHFCPLYFSEMPWSNLMKPCRNIICHVKLCL
jgi:hypothetical protein